MKDSKMAIIANAISAGVSYKIEYTGDGYEEPEMVWTEFDYQGFWNYLNEWYGEDVANIVFDACDDDIEEILIEMANNELI